MTRREICGWSGAPIRVPTSFRALRTRANNSITAAAGREQRERALRGDPFARLQPRTNLRGRSVFMPHVDGSLNELQRAVFLSLLHEYDRIAALRILHDCALRDEQ